MTRIAPAYLGIFEGHWDPAIAIVREGEILACAEEERFVRLKHAPRIYPARALKACLRDAGLVPQDIRVIAVNWDATAYSNGAMRAFFEQLNSQWPVDANTRQWQNHTLSYFNLESMRRRHACNWRRVFGDIAIPDVYPIPHHYVHALQAYFSSGFDRALCVTVDGSGDQHCTVLWDCRDAELRAVREICMPHSLGWFYAAFTEYLGFQAYDGEYKVMGLAAYGQADEELREKVNRVLATAEDGVEYRLAPRYIHYGQHTWSDRFTDDMVALFGRSMRLADEPIDQWHMNLAFEVQRSLEEAVCRLARWGIEFLGVERICVGGGVGLNVKMNSALFSLPGVRDLFVQPLCADGGAAAGAALGACWQLTGQRPQPLQTLALGPKESDDSIRQTLETCGIPYTQVQDTAEAVADELAQGRIVAWFQGAMEAGPRALGQRSILADPRNVAVRDRVNAAVKYREHWRPFCPSLPAEDAGKYLKHYTDARFMNVAFDAGDVLRERAPAIVHVDGTARVQLVHADVLPLFHRLLRAFERRTGIAVVLNTSFNVKGEPIVCTLLDALRTFFSTALDVLAAGSFLIHKSAANKHYGQHNSSNAGSCSPPGR
jgi:carbamoyltransferase